jgi:hypothetical protein
MGMHHTKRIAERCCCGECGAVLNGRHNCDGFDVEIARYKPLFRYPDGMDLEVIPLCDALNSFPGVATYESCCGHGKTEFHIWFAVDYAEIRLPPLLYWTNACHSLLSDSWIIEAQSDCDMQRTTFLLRSPNRGRQAYLDSREIAVNLLAQAAATSEQFADRLADYLATRARQEFDEIASMKMLTP